jgi:predicted nucleotidyltransferase
LGKDIDKFDTEVEIIRKRIGVKIFHPPIKDVLLAYDMLFAENAFNELTAVLEKNFPKFTEDDETRFKSQMVCIFLLSTTLRKGTKREEIASKYSIPMKQFKICLTELEGNSEIKDVLKKFKEASKGVKKELKKDAGKRKRQEKEEVQKEPLPDTQGNQEEEDIIEKFAPGFVTMVRKYLLDLNNRFSALGTTPRRLGCKKS